MKPALTCHGNWLGSPQHYCPRGRGQFQLDSRTADRDSRVLIGIRIAELELDGHAALAPPGRDPGLVADAEKIVRELANHLDGRSQRTHVADFNLLRWTSRQRKVSPFRRVIPGIASVQPIVADDCTIQHGLATGLHGVE